MNEQLQNQLAEIIAAIHRTAAAGADFALSQLPDIAQQYVIYGRVSATAHLLIGVAVVALSVWMFRKAAWANGEGYDTDVIWGMGGVLTLLFGVPFALIAMNGAFLVWFAPKVWLLKELAGLLK